MDAAVGVWQDLLAAGVDMGEGVMIEEDTIVDMPLEADTAEDTEVGLGATLHTESIAGRLGGYGHYSNTDKRKESKDPQSHQFKRGDPCQFAGKIRDRKAGK